VDGRVVVVRPFEPQDAPACARIHVTGWRTAYRGVVGDALLDDPAWARDREALWARAAAGEQLPPGGHREVAASGAVLGWSLWGPVRIQDRPGIAVLDDPARGELWALYVDPDAWGTGVADALMRSALAGLAAQGRRDVRLWVLAENPRARRFYARHGFVPTGQEVALDLGPGGAPVEVELRRA
jgi:ribosomal protein S18 acetylase RimI-like enzyme